MNQEALVGAFDYEPLCGTSSEALLCTADTSTQCRDTDGGEEGREGFSNCGSRVLNWLESNSYRALLVKYFYNYWVPNSGRVIYGLEWKDEIFG